MSHHRNCGPRDVSSSFLNKVLEEDNDHSIEFYLDGLPTTAYPMVLTQYDPTVLVGTNSGTSVLTFRDQVTQVKAEADAA